MEATDLIAEAKELLAKAEETIKNLEHAEAGQLRIVVARLRVFVEQHAHVDAPAVAPVEEPDAEEPAEAPKRTARPKKTEE
jgi:hypothetical protein